MDREKKRKQNRIAKVLLGINLMITYPLNNSELEAYAKVIDRELPDLDLVKLENLIIDFQVGNKEWNGINYIQNIFRFMPTNEPKNSKYAPK